MGNMENKLKEMGITLPSAPPKGGVYTPVKEFGEKLVYVSGCGPDLNGEVIYRGKLGKELTLQEGQEAAKCCMLNILAVLNENIGLDKIKCVVKLLVLVASDNDFYMQPQTANAASEILRDLLGEENGLASRSAIGVNVLPGNMPVEIEAIFELK